jgi:hypothetical protein
MRRGSFFAGRPGYDPEEEHLGFIEHLKPFLMEERTGPLEATPDRTL